MSNRKLDKDTGKKVYIPRAERRATRNVRRAASGAPPERFVSKDTEGKSSLGVVEPYDPDTGAALGPPRVAGDVTGKTAFLLEGVQFVYEGLGGHQGFLEWAAAHETKFREIAMKLIPAQVSIHEKQLGLHVVIEHSLPRPAYDPKYPVHEVHTVDEEGNLLVPGQTPPAR